jgi:hypothetical protein
LNKIQKAIVSMLVIAIMTFSASASLAHAATWASYSSLPWSTNTLVTTGQLTVAGSSTVGPIASEEINQGGFVAYWNSIAAGLDSSTITQVNLATLGSGTAAPALTNNNSPPADVGEMSRPLQTAEWQNTALNNLQQYAVGVDSVAIVLSPDMTWLISYLQTQGVTGLTTLQVANLFADTTAATDGNQGLTGVTDSTPLYTTWAAFFTAQGWTIPTAYSSDASSTIQRAVRDPTSGTFDCFDNYFAVPNGYQFEHKGYTTASPNQKTVDGTTQMAPFTLCPENQDIFTTVSTGTNYIGFISLGYLISQGGSQPGSAQYPTGTKMIGVNIAFNMASPPSGKTASPIITYYGTGIGFPSGSANLPSWGAFIVPTDANVIYAYSGYKGSSTSPYGVATGAYEAWRWLWEVTPGQIPSSGPCLVAGVWIAYMMAHGTTNTGETPTWNTASGIGTGTSNFAADQNYIPLDRDDMAGGKVLDSTLTAYTPEAGQTQTFPTGQVNFNDISYFVTAYIAYYANHIYNPYADLDANGNINFNDISLFVTDYIAYYSAY